MAFDERKYQKEYRQKNKIRLSLAGKEWREKNKEALRQKAKIYRDKNKEKIKELLKVWRSNNPNYSKRYKEFNPSYWIEWGKKNQEKRNESNKNFWKRYPEKLKAKKRRYYLKHKKEIFRKDSIRRKKRYWSDSNFKLAYCARRRIQSALRKNSTRKTSRTIELLGCSIPELRQYLEKQFSGIMSWSNFGSKGWHIDHIIPLAAFDLRDENQLKVACHYTNLQPLWWLDNIKKGAKIVSIY